jgi:hypothetical protein
MFSSKPILTALLAFVCLVALARTSDAALQLTLTAGASSTTVVDGGAGDADGLVNNAIQVSTTVGGYTFNLAVASSNSPGGAISFVSTGTNFIEGTGATTVSIYANATGFTSPTGDVDVTTAATTQYLAGSTAGNTATVTVNSYIDSLNGVSSSATGSLVGTDSSSIVGPLGNSALNDSQVATVAAPYALNLELVANIQSTNGTNRIDLDGTVLLSPVPEPATLAIWGLGAMGVLVAGRFRRKLA